MKYLKKVLILCCLLSTPLLTTMANTKKISKTMSSTEPPSNKELIEPSNNKNGYQRMFVFGDDLSDTGAFQKYAGTYTKTELVEGREAFSKWQDAIMDLPFYRSSFSDDKVAVALANSRLGNKELKPIVNLPHLKPNLKEDTNFATIGAKILKNEPGFINFDFETATTRLLADAYSLKKQVKLFERNFSQGENKITKNDLVIVNIGTNDVLDLIERFTRQEPVNIGKANAKIWRMGKVLEEQIRNLMKYGAENIVIWNMADFRWLPKYFNNFNDHKQAAAYKYTDKFNEMLGEVVKKLQINDEGKKNQQSIRIFNYRMHFINYLSLFEKLAGKNITKAAVRLNFERSLWLRQFTPFYNEGANSENLDNYAFLTETHISGAMHRLIGEELFNFINQ